MKKSQTDTKLVKEKGDSKPRPKSRLPWSHIESRRHVEWSIEESNLPNRDAVVKVDIHRVNVVLLFILFTRPLLPSALSGSLDSRHFIFIFSSHFSSSNRVTARP